MAQHANAVLAGFDEDFNGLLFTPNASGEAFVETDTHKFVIRNTKPAAAVADAWDIGNTPAGRIPNRQFTSAEKETFIVDQMVYFRHVCGQQAAQMTDEALCEVSILRQYALSSDMMVGNPDLGVHRVIYKDVIKATRRWVDEKISMPKVYVYNLR